MIKIIHNNTAVPPKMSSYRSRLLSFNSSERYRPPYLSEGQRSFVFMCYSLLEKKYAHTLTSGYVYAKKNNQTKTVVLRSRIGGVGKTKYLPSFSKEWKNLIYAYNKNSIKNIPVNDININKIIKSYFNLYFKDPSNTLLQPKQKTPIALKGGAKESYYPSIIRANKGSSSSSVHGISPMLWLERYIEVKGKKSAGHIESRLKRKRSKFLRRIYVSNAEIKHKNNKVIISLFTVNREKKRLKKNYLKINTKIGKNLIKRYFFLYRAYKRKNWNNLILKKPIDALFGYLEKNKDGISISSSSSLPLAGQLPLSFASVLSENTKGGREPDIKTARITRAGPVVRFATLRIKEWKKILFKYKLENLYRIIKLKNLCIKKIWGLIIRKYWIRYFKLLRKYDLMYSLNKYKFNKKSLLPILSSMLKKIIGKKKIRYNIINLKSIAYNTDIFTSALVLNIRKKKMQHNVSMLKLLFMAKLNSTNSMTSLSDRLRLRRYLPASENRITNLRITAGDETTNPAYGALKGDLFLNKYKDLKIISSLGSVASESAGLRAGYAHGAGGSPRTLKEDNEKKSSDILEIAIGAAIARANSRRVSLSPVVAVTTSSPTKGKAEQYLPQGMAKGEGCRKAPPFPLPNSPYLRPVWWPAPTVASRGELRLPLSLSIKGSEEGATVGGLLTSQGDIINKGKRCRVQGLDELLNEAINKKNIHKTVYNSVGYKNLGGIRLEVKGRLTKRYRADRSICSVKLKGGLKNIDSSEKGLSSVFFRGSFNSNISYSLLKSKRRIGAFAVKGWISGR